MNCKNIVEMSTMFIFLPVLIGLMWVRFLNIKGKLDSFIHAWVLGFVTMLSVGQLLLVPMVALHRTLTEAVKAWQICLTLLALLSFFLLPFLRQEKMATLEETMQKQEKAGDTDKKWLWILGIFVLILILLQAYIPARYEHRDDDDSRFISEEVSAVVHDTMFWDDPITADQLYWNEGEVKKDFTSPWAMYIAMCSRISNIPPAVLSHTYLPFFLIILCYGVYFLIGKKLLKGDLEKTLLFLLFLSVLHLWGYTSTHTLSSMLLLRIWQGKAVCASFMLPVLFYLMYQIMQKECKNCWIGLLYVASTAGCLLSGIGIVTTPIVLFVYGTVHFVSYRNLKKLFAIWMAALPCAVYLLYYLIR